MSEARDQAPGEYASHRHIIENPEQRKAFLLQVKGTVDGLRGAYRMHAILAVVAIALLFLLKPRGFLAEHRMLLVGLALGIDLLALAGLRAVAATPARYILPLTALDVLAALVMTLLSWRHGAFSLAWLLPLGLPVMLLLYWKDARAIQPVLAEHAAWRRAQEERG